MGDRGVLPSLRAGACRRSSPHRQPADPRTGVRRLYGPSALGAPIGGRFTPAVAQRIGMVGFLAGMIGIVTAINAGTLVLFSIATVLAGAGQGIAITAATRGLLDGSILTDRAPIFSAIYLICYGGATFPSLIAGQLSITFSLPQIALGYGGLSLVATFF